MRRLITGVVAGAILCASGPAFAEERRSLAKEFALSFFSGVLSAAYAPVKFALAVGAAPVGGVAGFVTGGNERAAEGIWRPTVGGSYFVTPGAFDGTEPFRPLGRGAPKP